MKCFRGCFGLKPDNFFKSPILKILVFVNPWLIFYMFYFTLKTTHIVLDKVRCIIYCKNISQIWCIYLQSSICTLTLWLDLHTLYFDQFYQGSQGEHIRGRKRFVIFKHILMKYFVFATWKRGCSTSTFLVFKKIYEDTRSRGFDGSVNIPERFDHFSIIVQPFFVGIYILNEKV